MTDWWFCRHSRWASTSKQLISELLVDIFKEPFEHLPPMSSFPFKGFTNAVMLTCAEKKA